MKSNVSNPEFQNLDECSFKVRPVSNPSLPIPKDFDFCRSCRT